MIGKLKGVIDGYGPDMVTIDVGGVGYEAFASSRTLAALPPPGGAATLIIETVMREDQIRLYAFGSNAERAWFRLLTTVQGVGARVALSVLSTLSVTDLASAVALSDKASLSRAPGVGPKVAARIVAELKDKAALSADVDPGLVKLQGQLDEKRAPEPATDAVSALVNLGYAQAQAGAAVAAAMAKAGEGARAEELIRLGLKELAR